MQNNINPIFINIAENSCSISPDNLVRVSEGDNLESAIDTLLQADQLREVVYLYMQTDDLWIIYSAQLKHETDPLNSNGFVAAIEVAVGEYDYRVNLTHGFTYTNNINLATVFNVDTQSFLRKDSSEKLIPIRYVKTLM